MKLTFYQRLRISSSVRVEWYRALEAFCRDQLPIAATLSDMQEEFARINHPMLPVVREVLLRMRGGRAADTPGQGKIQSLGVALAGLVPNNESSLIEAGETSGDVSLGLQRAAEYTEANVRLLREIRGPMMAPAFLMFMLIGILVFLAHWVLPTFAQISARARWPGYARAYGMLADNAIVVAVIVIVGGVLLTTIYLRLIKTWTGDLRDTLDQRLWPFTAVAQINSAAMLMSLSGFIQAGMPFANAIDQLARGSTPYMRDVYRRIHTELRKGRRPDQALAAAHIIDRKFKWMLRLYAKTSEFAPALGNISNRFTEFAISRSSAVFKVIGFGVQLLVVGFIAWTMLSMFGILQSVKGG